MCQSSSAREQCRKIIAPCIRPAASRDTHRPPCRYSARFAVVSLSSLPFLLTTLIAKARFLYHDKHAWPSAFARRQGLAKIPDPVFVDPVFGAAVEAVFGGFRVAAHDVWNLDLVGWWMLVGLSGRFFLGFEDQYTTVCSRVAVQDWGRAVMELV